MSLLGRRLLDVYQTEDEQLETLKKWWEENGKSALFGIVLGLGAIFGWRSWQANTIANLESASNTYQSALVATGFNNREEARKQAMEVVTNYENTGYAIYARLILAYIDNLESKYDSAEEHLKVALEKTENDSIRHEINLRLARVYIANNKADQALTIVTSGDPGNFAAQYNEVKGDVYAEQGKVDEARQAYQQAITDSESLAFDPRILNFKIENLR